jgi:hypothetical protein
MMKEAIDGVRKKVMSSYKASRVFSYYSIMLEPAEKLK